MPSPLIVFNGGTHGGKTTLLLHTFITVPAPTAIVTTVTLTKVHKGRFGLHGVARVPVIVGGSGSALDFSFTVKRSYRFKGRKQSFLQARCPDGKFKVRTTKTLFKNEAHTPGVAPQTVLSGGLVTPCKPHG